MDLLEGLQTSKLSFSSRSDSESPLQSQVGGDSPYPSTADQGGPLPAHTAWQLLLDSRLPFLRAELQAAADFLLLYSSLAAEDSEPSSPVKGLLPDHKVFCAALAYTRLSVAVCMLCFLPMWMCISLKPRLHHIWCWRSGPDHHLLELQ